jgi:hypothetical protein
LLFDGLAAFARGATAERAAASCAARPAAQAGHFFRALRLAWHADPSRSFQLKTLCARIDADAKGEFFGNLCRWFVFFQHA